MTHSEQSDTFPPGRTPHGWRVSHGRALAAASGPSACGSNAGGHSSATEIGGVRHAAEGREISMLAEGWDTDGDC